MVLVLLRRRSTLGVGVTVVFQRHDRELVELYLDSVTYEALSIYNVLANIVSARRYKKQPIAVIEETLLRRITVNPDIFGGKPIIRGMRISVELILSLLAQGETPETILTDYPDLEPDDLRACLAYAHAVIAHDKLDSVHISG